MDGLYVVTPHPEQMGKLRLRLVPGQSGRGPCVQGSSLSGQCGWWGCWWCWVICGTGDSWPSFLTPSASTPEPLHPPYRLQQVQIPLENDSDCEQRYGNFLHVRDNTKIIPEDMLCAGTLGRGPCMVRCVGQSCPKGLLLALAC